MGEVLIQVWLKSIKKWVSYWRTKWMHKKRVWKNISGAHVSPRKSVQWKWNKEKKRHACKNIIDGRRTFIIRTENSCHGYQPASDRWLLIQWRYYLFSKWVDGHQGDGFSSVGAQTGVLKLAMAGTQDWWRQFPPFLGCWFYMIRTCWVVDN